MTICIYTIDIYFQFITAAGLHMNLSPSSHGVFVCQVIVLVLDCLVRGLVVLMLVIKKLTHMLSVSRTRGARQST